MLLNFIRPIHIKELDSNIPMIDCAYVINLDARTDKWNRLSDIFNKMKIHANRFSAIDGLTITATDKIAMSAPNLCTLTGPELGCLLSHLSVLADASKRNFDRIIVWEDDIEFLEEINILPALINQLEKIDSQWDILYTDTNSRSPEGGYITAWEPCPRTGQHLPTANEMLKRTPINKDLQKIWCRYGAYSMIISRLGIRKILDYFAKVSAWVPYDWDLHYIPGLREYAPTSDIISNLRQGFSSDIRSVKS